MVGIVSFWVWPIRFHCRISWIHESLLVFAIRCLWFMVSARCIIHSNSFHLQICILCVMMCESFSRTIRLIGCENSDELIVLFLVLMVHIIPCWSVRITVNPWIHLLPEVSWTALGTPCRERDGGICRRSSLCSSAGHTSYILLPCIMW